MKDYLHKLITAQGPLTIERYMALCLGHPRFGYYMNRDPFGRPGDFTTAPEISQIYGELIGIWCVAAWAAVGSPQPFVLAELGPGRGTLLADILRAAKRHEGFLAAAQIHVVEMSPTLRKLQREKLGENMTWHDSIATLPQEPMIFVANEFFDALPIRQLIKHGTRYYERCVGLSAVGLESQIRPIPPPQPLVEDGLHEVSPAVQAIAENLSARLATLGGAGLVVDYGHLHSATGDTLQALKAHKPCGIFEYPGASDLTAHVDFEALARSFRAGGAEALAPLTQGSFLVAMGLEARLAALAASLHGQACADFISAARRLVDDKDMGHLFKVLAVAQKNRQPIYPFEVA